MTRWNLRAGWLFTGFVCSVFFAQTIMADAVIRSEAMFASTIAEMFVDEEGLIIDLEIGLDDLSAFRNLLPDGIYVELGYPPEPRAERLRLYSTQDFVVRVDGGEWLQARILAMGPEERLPRDLITGEPLPGKEGEKETVIRAQLFYAFDQRPDLIEFGIGANAAGASIGYVFYHQDIAVNDFRYVTPAQSVNLDWNDPWYSAFGTRALRRQNFAPMSGFIYVEPFEVRKEIILRPKDLHNWIDLGLQGRDTIPVDMQEELKRRVGEFLRDRHQVVIDNEVIVPELARVNFLERTLRTSRVIDPPEELDINSAILGVIFVYPTVEPLPQRVTMEWDLFNEQIQQVPASAVDQAGPMPAFLEPDFPVLEWQNFLKFPEIPTLKVIISPPTFWQTGASYAAWLFAILSAFALWRLVGRKKQGSGYAAAATLSILMLTMTAGSFWYSRSAALSDDKTTEIVTGLLHNIYRAFDFREEEKIYDVLDQSVEGNLLAQIYLETRRGLELENQGGARAKVKVIEMIGLQTRPGVAGGFIAEATWNVAGSVGHWGHIHQRKNQYQAVLDIKPVNGAWKLTSLEILEEQRL